ncbi:MAG: sel1 repeat family protein [Bacteroides sp.]|nr:sel1 repeat family protein [Bacteroides sp.]
MKIKIVLTLSLILITCIFSLAQFGASASISGSSWNDNNEAQKALHSGNYSKAISIWKKYEDSDISAQKHLGYVYETLKDYDNALAYYVKSANGGNTHAMLNLARLYYTGDGVNKDYKEAIKWLRKAAEYDSGVAMYNLGYMYLKGKGTEKSTDTALRWYKAAAAKGHKGAQKAVDILSKDNYLLIF